MGNDGKSYHHGDLKSAMISVARAMLEEKGPEAISFRGIAREVGVSQTAPYNHFDGKDHLLSMLAAEGFRELHHSQLQACTDTDTPEDCLRAMARDYVNYSCTHPQLYRLMFGAGVVAWHQFPEVKEIALQSYTPILEALTEYLDLSDESKVQELRLVAATFWSTCHGMSMLIIDGMLTPDKVLADSENQLIEMMTALMTDQLKGK